MNISGKIEKIIPKTGKNNKSYNSVLVEGVWFNDFKGDFKELKEGDSVEVEYTQNGPFNNLDNVKKQEVPIEEIEDGQNTNTSQPSPVEFKKEKEDSYAIGQKTGLACHLAQRTLTGLEMDYKADEYFEKYKELAVKYYKANEEIRNEITN